MTTSDSLLALLHRSCTGGATAIRVVTQLAPAGAAGDKVFPATYGTDDKGVSTYAVESRRLRDGTDEQAVLLDSVQSQANRMEDALKAAWSDGTLELPMLTVQIPDGDSVIEVTALDAPHRAADAIFRDSEIAGVRFRDSEVGRKFVASKITNATPLFGICPTALLFGQWDSTSDAGSMGAKFQRVVVSEIVGHGAVQGKRTASRLDPLQIGSGIEMYGMGKGAFTFDIAAADKDKKGQPVKTKPSEVNHGNVMPSVSAMGGFTVDSAEQVSVLSFPALRRLRFPTDTGETSSARDVAGRVVIAALALHAIALLQEQGYDLRSRCLLIPVERRSQWLGTTLADEQALELSPTVTGEVFAQAVQAAKKAGLPWQAGRIELTPTADLVELVRRRNG